MKYYRVEFETKMGGYKHWTIDVTTTNLKRAKETAQMMWEQSKNEAHMFHLRARVLKDDEELLYNYFSRV